MPAEVLAPDLQALVAAARVLSRTSYIVDGGRPQVVPSADGPQPPGDEGTPLIESLAKDLYQRLYTRRGAGGGRRPDPLAERRHVARLSAANRGRGTWEPGWRVHRLEDDRIAVVKDKVIYWARPEQVRGRNGRIAPHAPCRLLIPKELRQEIPGFFVAIGDAEAPWDRADRVLRLYWHLRSGAAAAWMGALTDALNAAAIPFRLKTLTQPEHYRRADAGVLYLESTNLAASRDSIRRVYRCIGGDLRPQVPMMTEALAPGLGWAEGPADGSSFGQHRCRLVAETLVAAFESRAEAIEVGARAVAVAFRQQDLDPLRPHLGPGSEISFPRLFGRRPGRRIEMPESAIETRPAIAPEAFLATARRLGDGLCRQAYWHQDRCNWVGAADDDRREPTAKRVLAALDASLYRGAAGVGLFLAELHRRTADEDHRRTAAGALRRALDPASADIEDLPPLGFFAGRLGVAWAARRGAALLADRDLTRRAEGLVTALLDGVSDEHHLDVYGGNAGAILALLGLHRATGDAGLLAAAETLGEEICSAAERDGDVWLWPNQRLSGIQAQRMLTGYSHGAGGVGLAFFELFAATGRPLFHAAATGAFAYEDALFDSAAGNWPDFREGHRHERRAPPSDEPAFMIAWCHGAPGIALARLRAMAIDPERAGSYAVGARAGLATTAGYLDEGLAAKDASICHGVCGLVDVLLVAADVLGEPEYRRRAERALGELAAEHGDRGDWPSGVPSRRPNPSLMLGEAGIGYTLLRCLDPRRIPSIGACEPGPAYHQDGTGDRFSRQ